MTWYEAELGVLMVPVLWFLLSLPGQVRALAEEDEVSFELSGAGQVLVVVVAVVTYSAAVRSWSRRAAARVVYAYERLGDEEARAVVRLLAFPANLVPYGFFLVLAAGVLLNVIPREASEAEVTLPEIASSSTRFVSGTIVHGSSSRHPGRDAVTAPESWFCQAS
ncbi:hypothetical protein ACFY9N_01190 [Microbacterium sp. NPDC008134]|uniref:hypothetical protein n=1 Tax=Microbacterium sp. NPDC008134 TaxID=3364183 RepID=UPI0036ED08DE